jgi:glutathione S-transferase
MMDLYAATTPNGRRPLFVLEELELPYRLHLLDLSQREQDRAEFRKLNPFGQVPVLVDPAGPDGAPIAITQSAAIIFYLAQKARGRLMPEAAPARIKVEQYAWMILSDVAAASTTIFFGSKIEGQGSKEIVDLFIARLASYLRCIDSELGSARYLCGELSLADFALLPLVILPHIARVIDEVGAANISRWRAEMQERLSVQRALAKSAHH